MHLPPLTTCGCLYSPRGGCAMIMVRGWMVDNCIIVMLTPTADPQEEKMWKTSLDQISEDDKWMIDAWIEDANGILAFVSLDLLVRLIIIFNDKL